MKRSNSQRLSRAGVFHADHHARQQALEDARRREVVGRADLLQVDRHRARRLRAVDDVAAGQPLRVARRCSGRSRPAAGRRAPPRRRSACRSAAPARARSISVSWRVHHALGVAGRARGEEHRRDVVGLRLGDLARRRSRGAPRRRRGRRRPARRATRGRARCSGAGRAGRRTRCARAAGTARAPRAACRPAPGPRRWRSATSALAIGKTNSAAAASW